jgi:hypothetical protein
MLDGGDQQRRVVAVGRCAYASYGDALPIHRRRAFGALLSPIHRAFAGLLPPTRGLCDASIHGHVGQLQADVAVVGFECSLPQRLDHPARYPLLASIPKRGGRTRLIGDPAVGAAENQDLNQLIEDYLIGDSQAVTAQRVGVHFSFGQQGCELFPNGSDDVWWECGHGRRSFSGSLITPRMIEHPVPAFQVDVLRPYPRSL